MNEPNFESFGAETEIMKVAELLGAGVAKALLGKAVLSDDLSYVTEPAIKIMHTQKADRKN